MARQRGCTKTGGRKKGTPNKVTATTRQWVSLLLDVGRDRFVESMAQLAPNDYVRFYLTLLNYEIPKRQSVGLQDMTPREVIEQLDLSSLTDEQRDALLELPNGENGKVQPIVINITEAKPSE